MIINKVDFLGAGSRRFESFRSDQINQGLMVNNHKPFFIGTYRRTYKVLFGDDKEKIKIKYFGVLIFY